MHRDNPRSLAAARTAPARADRVIRAPRGTDAHREELAHRGAAPDAAEQPRSGGRRESAGARRLRRHRPRRAQLGVLRRDPRGAARADDDESLLIQSGKPVGVFKTHADAPRVLIANSNLVPKWATWEHFNELDRKGLMMYGQMTAGSWIYIGSQGIVQGTYETFVEAGRQHYGGDLADKWILTAGLGGMGGAQPLAATMAGRVDARDRVPADRASTCACARATSTGRRRTSTTRSRLMRDACARADAGVGRPARQCGRDPARARRAAACGPTWSPTRPRRTTSSTATCRPAGRVEQWRAAQADPSQHAALVAAAKQSIAAHVEAMLDFHAQGIPTFDYGNNIRQVAFDEGVADAFAFPGFVPAYIRPLFCEGKGPFRWVALSGDPEDIYKTDRKVKELFPDNAHLHRWLDMARERIAFQGLPARICWLGLGERHRAGLAFNEMVTSGELKAPIVIGRDHLDTGSVASPNRETEAMTDGTDAVSDWPLLNALLNTAGGATWVSLHHGGGVGMGYSQHAGVVIVCDGTDAAAKRIERVLWNDPGDRRHAPRRRRLRQGDRGREGEAASTCRCTAADAEARRCDTRCRAARAVASLPRASSPTSSRSLSAAAVQGPAPRSAEQFDARHGPASTFEFATAGAGGSTNWPPASGPTSSSTAADGSRARIDATAERARATRARPGHRAELAWRARGAPRPDLCSTARSAHRSARSVCGLRDSAGRPRGSQRVRHRRLRLADAWRRSCRVAANGRRRVSL